VIAAQKIGRKCAFSASKLVGITDGTDSDSDEGTFVAVVVVVVVAAVIGYSVWVAIYRLNFS